jgi:hypothetical protein
MFIVRQREKLLHLFPGYAAQLHAGHRRSRRGERLPLLRLNLRQDRTYFRHKAYNL